MVLADRLGAGRRVWTGLAIWNAAADVVHGVVPRVMRFSMPLGSTDFQGLFSRSHLDLSCFMG